MGETRWFAHILTTAKRQGHVSHMTLPIQVIWFALSPPSLARTFHRIAALSKAAVEKPPCAHTTILQCQRCSHQPEGRLRKLSERLPCVQVSCPGFRNQIGSETIEPSVSEKIKKWGSQEEEALKWTLIWYQWRLNRGHDMINDGSLCFIKNQKMIAVLATFIVTGEEQGVPKKKLTGQPKRIY